MSIKILLHCGTNPHHKVFVFEATDKCKSTQELPLGA